jgi:hypothetical protein
MGIFYSIVFLVLLGLSVSQAFPTATGSCNAGTGAILQPGFSHASNAQVGTGPLSDAGISVTLNDDTLDPDTPTEISTMEEYNLTIVSDGTKPFTGFLARIGGSGDDPFLDTTTALDAYDTQAQVAEATCVQINRVGGVSHTNAAPKTVVSSLLKMDDAANGLLLDITVVIRNVDALNVSEWYFSRYELNAVAPPSMAPTTTRFPPSAPAKSGDEGAETPTSSTYSMFKILSATVVSVGAMVILA